MVLETASGIDHFNKQVETRDIMSHLFIRRVILFYFYDIEVTVTTDDEGKETKEFSLPLRLSPQMFMPGRGVIWDTKDLMGRRDETSLATLANLLEHGLDCGFLDTRTRQIFEVCPDQGDRVLGEDEVTIINRPKTVD